jgi:hypothetical protein
MLNILTMKSTTKDDEGAITKDVAVMEEKQRKVSGKCMKQGSRNSMTIDCQTQDDEDAPIPKASLHDVQDTYGRNP